MPYPRLLARRENSPGLLATIPGRARVLDQAAARGRLQDVRRDLWLDQPHDRLSAQGDRVEVPLRALARECPGQAIEEDLGVLEAEGKDKSARKPEASGTGGGAQNYLKLHSSFPPEFRARPGESWKDYWRSVEFLVGVGRISAPPCCSELEIDAAA